MNVVRTTKFTFIWQIKLPLAAYGTSATLVAEPLGVVLIFSSWNLPFGEPITILSVPLICYVTN